MTKIRKLSKRDYYRIYSLVPRLTIDLIIFHNDGLVLSRRDIPPCKGMWHLPGGTVLLGEIWSVQLKEFQGRKPGCT